jgi:UDP-glucose 4-epimerase
MMSKVLVVGGSGFIGKRLLENEKEWFNCDLKGGSDFCTSNELWRYDVVILLAGWHLNGDQSDYYKNLQTYESLVRQIRQCDLINREPHIIFASSAAVYSPSLSATPWRESDTCSPQTLYGRSKLLGENIVRDTCKRYTILRFSNVFGEGDGHGVVDQFIRDGNTIYGDGTDVRDFIYVGLVAEAIQGVVREPGRFNGRTLNISSGKGRTVNEVWEEFGHGTPTHLESRKGDVAYSVLDNTCAEEAGLL